MILNIFIILIVGAVAYFHYVQGFFSATLSAMAAVIAAALALSYYEPVVHKLLAGKFADTALAMTLCILYAVIYVVIRTVMDKFVPGNLRLPVLAEKVGAGLMGVVAGLMAGGIVAIAAQSLPFGSSVGGFSRYETNDSRDVQLPTGGQSEDTYVYGELKDPDLAKNREGDRQSLWVPADRVVLAAVRQLSGEDGSLAGRQPLAAIHPDLQEELFLSNLGIQTGAKFAAVNNKKKQDVTVKGLFTVPSVPQSEGELDAIRKRNLPATLTPKGSDMILVVRVMFDRQASDTDNKVRFSTGACRLVAGGEDYYPVGTLEKGRHLYANALDDFLVTPSDKGADLVYVVPRSAVLADPKAAAGKEEVADGVFVEVKRLARVDLSGKKVVEGVRPSADVEVLRKPLVVKAAGQTGKTGNGGGGEQVSEAAASGPLQVQETTVNDHLQHQVGTGTADKTVNNFQTASATGALADGKFTKLEVNGTESVQRMAAGSYAADTLGAPAGQKVVQVHMIPQGNNPWDFESQIGAYQLKDEKGQQYPPHGVVAMVKTPDGGDRMVARYNAGGNVSDVPHADGRPTDVWLVYVVPAGTHVTAVTYNGQNAGAADVTVQ